LPKTRRRSVDRRKTVGRRPPNAPNTPPRSNRCWRDEVVDVRLCPPRKGWTEIDVVRVPKQVVPCGMTRFKNSEKWYKGCHLNKRWHTIPFIDRAGRIYATSLGVWKCTPAQLLATITSTVFKRLWSRRRYQSPKIRDSFDTLFNVSALYAITNDDSFFQRCSEMAKRPLVRQLRNYVYFYKTKLGKSKRLLFDQLRFACLWLQSRSYLCRNRECPTRSKKDPETSHPALKWDAEVRRSFAVEVNTWATVYCGPGAKPPRDHCPARHLKASEGWSFYRGNQWTSHS